MPKADNRLNEKAAEAALSASSLYLTRKAADFDASLLLDPAYPTFPSA